MNTTSPTRSGDATRDRGFTLIELMVVVLIIAILLAIAIPTFLGAQNKAKDRNAQSSVRNTLTAAKTIFSDEGDYTDATLAALGEVEPAFDFVDNVTVSDDPKEVSINTPSATAFYAAAESATGTCYYIKDIVAAPTGGTEFAYLENAGANCTSEFAETALAAAFTQTWSSEGW